MSLISFDFIAAAAVIEKIEKLRERAENACGDIGRAFHSLEDMELGRCEDELSDANRSLKVAADNLWDLSERLRKICRLYESCEDSIAGAIAELPCSLMRADARSMLFANSEAINFDGLLSGRSGVFSGKSVINEDWLDDIILWLDTQNAKVQNGGILRDLLKKGVKMAQNRDFFSAIF